METVFINDDNNITKTLINIVDGIIYPITYIGNKKVVDWSFFKYLEIFKLSSNNTLIRKENDYDVYLDNETNFLHFLKKGINDYAMFFKYNGVDATYYLGKNKKGLAKKFTAKNIVITITLSALLMLLPSSEVLKEQPVDDTKVTLYGTISEENSDITLMDIGGFIYSSPNLESKEKGFLFNRNFFRDILPFINRDSYTKDLYTRELTDVSIKSFDGNDERYKGLRGFYLPTDLNSFYIKDYNDLDEDDNKDPVAHEFVHLCQVNGLYGIFIEATAEIISVEYFDGTKLDAYPKPIKIIKKLSEVIGAYPVMEYVFTGDFSTIEAELNLYLDSSDYNKFISIVKKDFNELTDQDFTDLDILIAKAFKTKYGYDASEDIVMNLLDKNDQTLVRYYFDSTKFSESSYYLDYDHYTLATMSIEDALMTDSFNIYVMDAHEIREDLVQDMYETGEDTYKEIEYDEERLEITNRTITGSDILISGYYDGLYFEDISEDYLEELNIINYRYYCYNSKRLTYEEYLTGNYDLKDLRCFSKYAEIKDGKVIYRVPNKVYLPDVGTRTSYTKDLK